MQPIRTLALAALLSVSVFGCATEPMDDGDASDSRVSRVGNGKADEPPTPLQNNHNYQVDITGFDLGDLPTTSGQPLRLNLGGEETECDTYGGVLTCEGREFSGRRLRDGVDVEFDLPTYEEGESGIESIARGLVDGARFGETGEFEVDVDVDWDGLKIEGVKVTLTLTY